VQPEELPYPVLPLVAGGVGILLAARRPRHPVGWLLLTLGLLLSWGGLSDSYARWGLLVRPGSLPAARLVAVVGDNWIVFPALIGWILLLTPDGRLPSPRWRWWAWVAAAAPVTHELVRYFAWPADSTDHWVAVNPMFVRALYPLRNLQYPLILLVMVSVIVAAVSVGVRLRRATGIERQQLRLVAGAAGMVVLAVPLILIGIELRSSAIVLLGLLGWVTVVCLAICAAILRYRLYVLDHLLSRTIGYGLLTAVLAGLYAVGVLVIGHAVSPGGRTNSLVVAATTLGVAAAFQPLRRRIQRIVDRRFDRRRYDAARTIDAFAGRLRDQVDLATLRTDLLTVVDDTMSPATTDLWLRPQARASGRVAALGVAQADHGGSL
jgi:hypothetical protein